MGKRPLNVLAVRGTITAEWADYMIMDRNRARAMFRVRLFRGSGEMIIRTPATYKVVTGEMYDRYFALASRALNELYIEEDKEQVA